MLVIVGLSVLLFAGVIAFVGVLSNAGVAHPLCGCVAVAHFTSNANATLNWCSCLSPDDLPSETAGQRRFQHAAAAGTVSRIRCDIGSFPHDSAASAVSRLKARLAATRPTGSPARHCSPTPLKGGGEEPP